MDVKDGRRGHESFISEHLYLRRRKFILDFMFEIKGKYLRSRFYARKIPPVSFFLYEMSRVPKSSFWYKTVPFPTRIISLEKDFYDQYNRRLQKYLRQAETENMEVRRPDFIPDLQEMFQSAAEAKNIGGLLPGTLRKKSNYHYSEVHHPGLGRLAAHLSIGDRAESMVFGFVNASAFRDFTGRKEQRLCSTANKYLFHKDMEYFRDLGYQFYDMVGISEPMNQMKKEFGGEIVMTYNHIPLPVYYLQTVKKRWF